MPLAKAERPNFAFNRGIHSDASPVTFPENFSTDELNFELMLDGTRRRRRGLQDENEVTPATFPEAENGKVRTFKWRSVGGNPDLNFHCWQVGGVVYFADDVPNVSDNIRGFTLPLVNIAVDGFSDEVADSFIDMAFGRGHAIVVGKYIEPSYLVYDPDDDDIDVLPISIRERDFQGIDDGVDNVTRPTTLTDSHQYNLVNQGWIYGDVLAYFTSQNEYPAKNMIPWLGYRRQSADATVNPDDGTKQFSPDKLIKELFQDAPSPRGHFIVNPFDTSVNLIVETEVTKNYVTSFEPSDINNLNFPNHPGPPVSTLVNFTFDSPHFLSVGENVQFHTEKLGKRGTFTGDGNGFWNIGFWTNGYGCPTNFGGNFNRVEAVINDNRISAYITLNDDGAGWRKGWPGFYPVIYAYVGGDVVDLEGETRDERPTVCAFFAGRAVFGGIPHPDLGSALYFSQVVEIDGQYGKCYQVADPTSETISDIVPTDGLVLRIPEIGRLYKLLPYGNSLLAFAAGGVWQIGPGASGYFTATSYSVRKISDVRCVNGTSVVDAEGVPCFWASSGIFGIVQDTNTGFLIAQSLTQEILDTLYSSLGTAARATSTADFDAVNKRILWTYYTGERVSEYALVYDLRFRAFTHWKFEVPVYDIFTSTDKDEQNSTTVRFIVFDGGEYRVAVAADILFQDYGTNIDAYLLTGFDTAKSPTRRKYAPVVTVFMKRTEVIAEDDEVDSRSSILLQARWDWADNTVAGKWGTSRQAYRPLRPFTLSGSEVVGDPLPDGTPIVVTRNKIRGRGRALQLKYAAEVGKDAHILGWSINYAVLTDN